MLNSKVYKMYELSAHQTNALLSDIILFLVRAACELRSAYYEAKRTLHTHFYKPFCLHLHAQLKN